MEGGHQKGGHRTASMCCPTQPALGKLISTDVLWAPIVCHFGAAPAVSGVGMYRSIRQLLTHLPGKRGSSQPRSGEDQKHRPTREGLYTKCVGNGKTEGIPLRILGWGENNCGVRPHQGPIPAPGHSGSVITGTSHSSHLQQA